MLTPWTKSYDQPREHIEKQRHYFANKGPSSQGYGFSSSHVWMWELDCEESWVPKNGCFWTVVLEKTLESPLDCKEIQPVHSEGDQPWDYFGKNDVKLKLQYFGHLIQRVDSLEKTLMLGGIGGRRRRGRQRMRWLDGITDWMDLLAVQGTLKSLLQHHSSKASILRCSASFTVQLSHPYLTTGKTIALTRRTFVGKVMSLLFNMLSRLVITFLPRSKRLLTSWLQSPSAGILEPRKMKFLTVSTVSPSISHEVMGPDAMILVFWMLSFKTTFSLSSFTLIKRLFSFSSLSAIRVVSSAYLRLLIFLPAILIQLVLHPAQYFPWSTLYIS